MWPFTGKRIFGSRWWALGFAAFVCWQAVELTSPGDQPSNQTDALAAKAIEDAFGKN